jgi:hypothetical protein
MGKNNSIDFITTIFILILFIACSYSESNDSMKALKSCENIPNQNSLKDNVKLEYQIVSKDCGALFAQIRKNTYSILKKDIKIQIIKGGGACNYACRLEQCGDTLNVGCNCLPNSFMKHKACYLISCKIIGLSKGIYFLNYGDGIKRIRIK